MDKKEQKTFITEYEQEDGKYAGPHINARSWEEGRSNRLTIS